MTTVLYRPELQNPPRDATISFTYATESDPMTVLSIKPGVNRKINSQAWDSVLKSNSSLKKLLRIGAIEVIDSQREAEMVKEAEEIAGSDDISDVLGLRISKAKNIVDVSTDTEFLQKWANAEGRPELINYINAQIVRLKMGLA